MERTGNKEKHEYKLKAERQKELLIALGRRRDWKSKRAREEFRRPAFEGTALEPGRERKELEKRYE